MGEMKPFFAYRTWSISALHNMDLLEKTLDRALQEAPRHNISCIEIQDYAQTPMIGWVDLASRFQRYPRLAQAEALTWRRRRVTPAERGAMAQRLRACAQKVRRAGLELQVWYHCFRDWPQEVTTLYPEVRDADGQALYDFLADQLRDTFDVFPEIDGLTVTSLHETPSILRFSGAVPQADRIYRLYNTFVKVCEEKKKRLILRDFIVRQDEFQAFDEVLDRLPDHVVIQTKSVVADWAPHEKPVNPFIFRYVRKPKRLVVEFELANNYTGEMDFPWCDPEQIWRHIRLLAAIGAHGAVGRLLNTDRVVADTIFDTPNEVDVWAFTRTLVDPGRLLLDPKDAWWHDYDVFDMSVWRDWAKLRFGDRAADEVVMLLQQTPRLTALTLNICGAFFLWPWRGERRDEFLDNHVPFAIKTVRRCGPGLALAEKQEAARIVEQCIARVEALRGAMPADGYKNVRDAFERARHVVAIYKATAEAFLAALEVGAGRADRGALAAALEAMRAAASRASEAYGEYLCERAPATVPFVADYLARLPERIDAIMDKKGMYGKE